MSKKIQISLLIAIFFAAGPAEALAQSGMDFLNIGPTTRSLSLGEAVTALPMGASSIYTNPANLAFDSTSSLSADYTLWIADVYNSHLAVNLKSSRGSFGFGLLNSSANEFEARTRPGPADGTFSVSYLSLAAAYARSIGNIAFGGAIQFLREQYLVNDASGYAFSVGLAGHWMDRRLRAGMALLNRGSMNDLVDTPTPLPSTLRVGAAAEIFTFTPPKNRDLPILVTLLADYVIPLEEEIDDSPFSHNPNRGFLNVGMALDVAGTIVLRGGFKTGDTERPASFGVGFSLETVTFNYAMIPFNTGFGTVHSVGMQYHF